MDDKARLAVAIGAVMVVVVAGISQLPFSDGAVAAVSVVSGGGVAPSASAALGAASPTPEPVRIIGLPPEGATPSNPKPGELVVRFEGTASGRTIWLYADGRLSLSRFHHVPEDAGDAFIGLSEQRLTPSGVEFLRSAVASTGLFASDLVLAREGKAPYLEIQLRNGDRLVKVTWAWRGITKNAPVATPEQMSALTALSALLTDPSSWPDSAWADPAANDYVPSEYLICFGVKPRDPALGVWIGPREPGAIWTLLPEPAQDLLRIDDRTQQTGMHDDLGCSRVSTDDARALARIFDDAGIRRDQPEPRAFWLRYTFEDPGVPGNKVWIQFAPIMPDGMATWLGPG